MEGKAGVGEWQIDHTCILIICMSFSESWRFLWREEADRREFPNMLCLCFCVRAKFDTEKLKENKVT